jgi:hypothetical protein
VWMGLGALALLASLVFIPLKHAEMLDGLDRRFVLDGRLYADLEAAGEAPGVRRVFDRCGRLSTAEHRPIPYIRFWLDGDPGSVGTIRKRSSPLSDLLLVPRDVRNVRRFYRANHPRRTARRPPGWRTLYLNRSWKVYAAPAGCAG